MKIEVNGIQIHYELSGNDEDPVVMLSHSLGSSRMMWEPQIPALEPRFRVLSMDTRGHGGSDAPEGAYTLAQLGEDAVKLLDALGIGQVHFVGLSMGGMIGQTIALNDPDRVKSLALCDTSAFLPADALPVWRERMDMAREKGMEALLESTLERWFTPPYLLKNPHGVQLIRTEFLNTPISGYIGCSEAICKLDYLKRLKEISTPCLIMVGEDDPGTPVAASEAMHEAISGSRLVVIPSAAHLSNIEQSGFFNENLLGFLENI